MAAFDAQSSATPATSGTTATWTHTPVGTPTGVVVFAGAQSFAATGVTYGGVSLTLVGSLGNLSCWASTAAPSSGAQTVIATFAGPGTTTDALFAGAVTVTGGNPTSPIATSASGNSGASLTLDLAITIGASEVGVAAAGFAVQGDTLTSRNGSTQTWNQSSVGSGQRSFGGVYQAGAASSIGIQKSFSTSGFDMVAVSMADASGGATVTAWISA